MIIFAGKKLSPAPLLNISKTVEEEKGGRVTARKIVIRMEGHLIAHKGSPRSDGSFWTLSGEPPDESIAVDSRHTAILTKQAALRSALEQQNAVLEVHPWDAGAPTKFIVRLRSLDFPADTWHGLCKWSAVFDADEQGVTNVGVESLSENWQIETQDENLGLYRVTHNISVRGRDQRAADGSVSKYAWQHARDYALQTVGLGLDASKAQSSGVLDLDVSFYNYLRTESVDEVEGTVQLGESWVGYDAAGGPAATHEQSISRKGSLDGTYTVVVDGTIQGYRTTDNATYATTATKAANRDAKWALVEPGLYAAATGYFGGALHTWPTNYSVQSNQVTGAMTYSAEYSNRPVAELAVGSIYEAVSIRDTNAPDVYALIPVPGRAAGPVAQDIGTQGPRRRVVSVEIQMPARTISYSPTIPDTDAYVATLVPSANYVFVDSDDAEFNANNGRYSRSVTWTYTN